MDDFTFNTALGRAAEFYNRVDTNDPPNSALIVVGLKAAGLQEDDVLRDHDTLAAILAASNDEATNAGYARKVLTDADLAAFAPDDAQNLVSLDIADQSWAAVQAAGGAWGGLLICYDPDTTAGTDSTIVPLTAQKFEVTPDGSTITAKISANGFFQAIGKEE